MEIFKHIEDSYTWRTFSHVSRTTYRISKILLKLKEINEPLNKKNSSLY